MAMASIRKKGIFKGQGARLSLCGYLVSRLAALF